MALSRNQFRESVDEAGAALASNPNLSAAMTSGLTRIVGLALLRSGDRKAGLRKCEEAYATARKLGDPGEVFDAGMAFLEALLASRDSARANDLFRSLEPSWAAHPESRWRAFALMARFGPQSADRANEAIGQLEALWGHEAFLQYLKAFASPFAVQFR
jgi:hypothetical protein